MQATHIQGGHGVPTGFRIQSSGPIQGPLWPRASERQLVVRDRGAAITLAAKSRTVDGSEIEVVHLDSGEVVFRKPGGAGQAMDAFA